jgi:hypothetical protein
MAIGLTRSKNLSESNLNLKTALQKLYSPGIENDIELFSLSSSVESIVLSGAVSEDLKQIFRLSSEQIRNVDGSIQKRTKFSTKYFTFTNDNEVYFTNYTLGVGNDSAVVPPAYSVNGSIPDLDIIEGGGGFYFTELNGAAYDAGTDQEIDVENIRLEGAVSGASSALATVTFVKQHLPGTAATYSNPAPVANVAVITVTMPNHGLVSGNRVYVRYTSGTGQSASAFTVTVANSSTFTFTGTASSANTAQSCVITNAEELLRFTPTFTTRYSVKSIEITDPGEGYLVPETLRIMENQNVIISGGEDAVTVRIIKQYGELFSGQPATFRTKQFTYVVRGADSSGFFLYDRRKEEYVFVDRTTSLAGFPEDSPTAVEIKRFDGINISNLLQFKFSQSPIWLRYYGEAYRIEGGSISGVINGVAAATDALQQRTQAAVQNTRRPTPSESSENILGYKYNSFVGQDVVFWQRVVLRDQDYLLAPSASITGTRLRTEVNNFQISDSTTPGVQLRVPGLFIKVGTNYYRAFSTTDKPFYKQNYNPQLLLEADKFALSAEDSLIPSPTQASDWYAYNSSISELAQRISPTGVNGALYYHRDSRPSVRSISTNIGNIYAVPLFTLVG